MHGNCKIPNTYNKTYVEILIASICNYIYLKTENTNDTLFPNINLSNYYTKSEVYGIDNELSTLILNTYTKTEVDTLVYTKYPRLSSIMYNFYAKTEIASALSDYTTSAQLHTDCYSKVKTNLVCDTYTPATQLYNDLSSKGYVNQMLVQSTTLY